MLDALVRPVISFSLDCELLKKMRRDKVEEIFKPKFFDNASKFTWDNLHIFTSFCFIFIFGSLIRFVLEIHYNKTGDIRLGGEWGLILWLDLTYMVVGSVMAYPAKVYYN